MAASHLDTLHQSPTPTPSHPHHSSSSVTGLTVEDATSLLGVAARMRITPVVKDLVNMWKSDTGAAKRDDKVTQSILQYGSNSVDPTFSSLFIFVNTMLFYLCQIPLHVMP
jgi:hypothetical protein